MDSVFTKITNSPQITKWTTVTDDADFTSTGTFLRVCYIPKKAKLMQVHYNVDEQFSGGSTAMQWKIGYPAGVSQSDGSTTVSAADIIANFDLDAVTAGSYVKSLAMTQPPLVNDTSALSNSNIASYSTSGEYDVVPVVSTFTVGTGAPTAGSMTFWYEFAFDANIVWNQDSLS